MTGVLIVLFGCIGCTPDDGATGGDDSGEAGGVGTGGGDEGEGGGECTGDDCVPPNPASIRLVNTGDHLAVGTVISKQQTYAFDHGAGQFRGHYHHADLGASAPVVVASPAFAADHAFRYFIPGNTSGGSGSSYRSSLAFGEEWRMETNWQGKEHWIGWAIRLDDDYPYPAPGYAVTMQLHSISWLAGNEQESPVWAIRTRSNGQWAYTNDKPLTAPEVSLGSYEDDIGTWVTWVVNIKYGKKGFVRVWKNKQLVHERYDYTTYADDELFGYYVPGLYNSHMRSNSAPDFGAVISDFRIADEGGSLETVSPETYKQ